ncbi:MAG: carboxylate-amine ligase [Rhodobacteraceae bacterium]|nr:carboxylate-amine ligase [Paracoccaceae bacterium]
MVNSEPDFTIGVEEEYLLVDKQTKDLAEAPDGLMQACAAELEDQVSPEFLQCQIEIGTKVCASVGEAREDLRHLRSTVAKCAAEYGLAPIAVSCHPFAEWKKQHHTNKDRYNALQRDLGGVASRLLICGMHVHVGVEDPEQRADLSNQFAYFLPHLLALSSSSPYWQGQDTGLASYRLTIFDNLPRTGLPPQFSSWGEFERSVQVLIDLGVIEDSSKIWWDLRPSSRFPTLETRICDVTPRLEHTLTLAALTQATIRMLHRLGRKNQRWRLYDLFLVGENRWRAQRYGTTEGIIDFGRREIVPFDEIIDEWLELIEEDAGILQSTREVHGARDILDSGTSAERQRAVFAKAREDGADSDTAMRQVVAHLIDEFHADL